MAPFAGAQGTAGRVAWLLRVNRLLGDNADWRRTSSFAAAVKGGCYPRSASESTVSRWETGGARPSYRTIRRYEELLGLAPGNLVAPVDALHRYVAPPGRPAPALARPDEDDPAGVPYRRIEELLDRVPTGDPMSGADWDELTGHLAIRPAMLLVPSRLWTDLATRLLGEMIASDGLAWMQRCEAMHRLLGHPVGQAAAVGACASLIADPSNQVFIETMVVLDATSHPDSNRLVLNQLTQPTNSRSHYGALMACVRKVRDGHLSPDQLVKVVGVIADAVQPTDAHPGMPALAVDVLRRLPGPLRVDIDRRLRGVVEADRTLREVHAAGRLAATAPSQLVVNRIVHATLAGLVRESAGFTDELLPVLVDELLFAPVLDAALHSALLLRSTPYGPAVAAALAAELATARVVSDPPLACAMLAALRIVGQARQRPLIERLALAPGLRSDVASAAISCLAHIGGASSDRFWLAALDRHGLAWRRHRGRHSADALTTLVYGLGIARNLDLLAQVRADNEAPPPARRAAGWWLDRPVRFYDSVRS